MVLSFLLFMLKVLFLLFLLGLFIYDFYKSGGFNGAIDYLDLIKYTQSYIKSFIKDYIGSISISHYIGFIDIDFNTFIYINSIEYGILIIVVISIGDSISIIIVFFVKTSIGFIYMCYRYIML